MVKTLCREIELRQTYLLQKKLSSLYFGGGTPSLLTGKEIRLLIETVKKYFELDSKAEITLEANPEDLTLGKIEILKKAGVNRLSIGIQSFEENQLVFMKRSHTVEQSYKAIENARKMGIENFSIDLIYGLREMSLEEWRECLKIASKLKPPHISAYALTVEPKTALYNWIKKGKLKLLSDEIVARHFEQTQKYLAEVGYEHYEVSNFALKGKRAIHNSSYWRGKSYLGIGPSAHSYDGKSRQWNVANNHTYLKEIWRGKIPAEKEELTLENRYNEMIMVSLRMIQGISIVDVNKKFGARFKDYLEKESASLVQKGDLMATDGYLSIPSERRFYSDGIASRLFYT